MDFTRRFFALGVLVLLCVSLQCVQDPPAPTRADTYRALKEKILSAAGEIAHEVERFRGKAFSPPVTVCVFTPNEYSAKISGLNNANPAQQKLFNDVLGCQGLLHPGEDYFSSYSTMVSSETSGFYVAGTDSLFVVLGTDATDLTGQDYVTLFHEFVHALQDQSLNLTLVQKYSKTCNQRLGLEYALEGEATLFHKYFTYLLMYGDYPAQSDSILRWLDTNESDIQSHLDSLHAYGAPLIVRQPTYWAYYSYGPKFINAIAGMDWDLIDNKIYPKFPFGVGAVLFPARNFQERMLNAGAINDLVNNTQRLIDVDELGPVITSVLFREWDFPGYKTIMAGLLADDAIVYTDRTTDTLRFIWYTNWAGGDEANLFWKNYVPLLNKKWKITLPDSVMHGDTAIIKDPRSGMYLEKYGTNVFVIEHYVPLALDTMVNRLRTITTTNRSRGKEALSGVTYPCLDKSLLRKLFNRDGFLSGVNQKSFLQN